MSLSVRAAGASVEERYRLLADVIARVDERARPHPALAPLPLDPGPRQFRDGALEPARKALAHRRLLLLHAVSDLPLAAIGRQVVRDLEAAPPADVRPIALEFVGRRKDLLPALKALTAPAAILLAGGSRALVGWEIDDLLEALTAGGHYLLVTTGLPREAWRLAKFEAPLWHELGGDGLYSVEYVEERLRAHLLAGRLSLPPTLRPFPEHARSLGGLPLADLARSLRTPLHAATFVARLCRLDMLGPSGVPELAAEVAAQPADALIDEWFQIYLDRNGQLLALGAALLGPSDEDAALAALQELLARVWSQSEEAHDLLDRGDLEGLEPLLAEAELSPRRRRVEPRTPATRARVIRAASGRLRRHLRLALIWLVGRARPGQPDAEAARPVVAEALAEVGAVDLALVEDLLVDLAVSPEAGDQDMAARALARWHERGATAELVALLRRWVSGREVVELARSLAAGVEGAAAPADSLRAAATLALARAGTLDRPGTLDPAILDALSVACAEPGPHTRHTLRDRAIGLLAPRHARAARDVLRELTRYDDLRAAISEHLARNYPRHQREVAGALAHWLADAEAAPPYTRGDPPSAHDTALATMALTMGQLPASHSEGLTSGELGRNLMRRLIDQPRHPMVRAAARAAMIRQGRHNPALYDELFDVLTPGEVDNAVAMLRDLYLEERAGLPGGDGTVVIGERSYPVFLSGERPKTGVEQAIDRWLAEDDDNTPAREVALKASAAFVAALDMAEAGAIRERRYTTRPAAPPVPAPPPPAESAPAPPPAPAASGPMAPTPTQPADDLDDAGLPGPRGLFAESFVPLFVTLDAPALRDPLEDLLPHARRLRDASPEALDFLLRRKWPGYNSELAEGLAPRLRRALDLEGQGWAGLTVADAPRAARALYGAAAERNQLWAVALVLLLVVVLVVALVVLAGF